MMYKPQRKQIGIWDFGQAAGAQVCADNRWVKKAGLIPWESIEERYAALFPSPVGKVAKPLRLALGALLIQTERGTSDEETVLQIRETPCLQYFCGLPEYKDENPFDPSLMVHFRKRLTPEILGEINEMILSKALPKSKDGGGGASGGSVGGKPQNKGSLTVDATCAPQKIRFPQDTSLLNEARENLEQMIDTLHSEGKRPRTYRIRARKDFLRFAKKRTKTAKEVRQSIRKQLQYIRRDLAVVDKMLKAGAALPPRSAERLETVRKVYAQQQAMYDSRTNRVDNRIVSLSQPHVRPIVRGKAKAKCEFGAKLDISVTDGFVRLEYISFDPYNECETLKRTIERFKERTGFYPAVVRADQIYRTRENRDYCAGLGIRLSGKPLGRPPKEDIALKRIARKDAIDRIEVERGFAHAKGSFGLDLIRTKLPGTSKTAIALTFVALNLAKLFRFLLSALRLLFRFFDFLFEIKNYAAVQ